MDHRDFTDLRIQIYDPWSCNVCGAIVNGRGVEKHVDWHNSLDGVSEE